MARRRVELWLDAEDTRNWRIVPGAVWEGDEDFYQFIGSNFIVVGRLVRRRRSAFVNNEQFFVIPIDIEVEE